MWHPHDFHTIYLLYHVALEPSTASGHHGCSLCGTGDWDQRRWHTVRCRSMGGCLDSDCMHRTDAID